MCKKKRVVSYSKVILYWRRLQHVPLESPYHVTSYSASHFRIYGYIHKHCLVNLVYINGTYQIVLQEWNWNCCYGAQHAVIKVR